MKLLPTRRQILFGTASLLGVGVTVTLASIVACSRRDHTTAQAKEQLLVVLSEIPAPDRLALRWHGRTMPSEDLLDLILAKPNLAAAIQSGCPDTRRALAVRQMETDFRSGDFTVVDRLVVSHSECLIASICLGRKLASPLQPT